MLHSLRLDFWDILIAVKEACTETMPDEERSVILRSHRTRILSLGVVEPTKLQEGTYLQTPCKAKPKDLSASCIYDYLYITTRLLCILVHNIMTSYHSIFNNHLKDLEGL